MGQLEPDYRESERQLSAGSSDFQIGSRQDTQPVPKRDTLFRKCVVWALGESGHWY
ncbi:MAG: hypothetical protein ACFBSG_01950 [Leptolyngbyaceae cyanobacterium]